MSASVPAPSSDSGSGQKLPLLNDTSDEYTMQHFGDLSQAIMNTAYAELPDIVKKTVNIQLLKLKNELGTSLTKQKVQAFTDLLMEHWHPIIQEVFNEFESKLQRAMTIPDGVVLRADMVQYKAAAAASAGGGGGGRVERMDTGQTPTEAGRTTTEHIDNQKQQLLDSRNKLAEKLESYRQHRAEWKALEEEKEILKAELELLDQQLGDNLNDESVLAEEVRETAQVLQGLCSHIEQHNTVT